MKCDVRIEEDILNVFEVAKKQFGGVDVCINNAGLGYSSTVLEGTTSDWKETLDVSHSLPLCCLYAELSVSYIDSPFWEIS